MKKTTLLLSLFVLGTYAIPTTVNAQTEQSYTQTIPDVYNGTQRGVGVSGGGADSSLDSTSAGYASWDTLWKDSYDGRPITGHSATTTSDGNVTTENYQAVLNNVDIQVSGISYNQYVAHTIIVNGVSYAGYLTDSTGSHGEGFMIVVKQPYGYPIYEVGQNFAYINPKDDVVTPPTSEPSTSEPSTSEPSTSEPSTSEPSTSEPSTSEPSTSEPSTSEPSTSEPSTSEPSTSEPSTTEPSTETPDTSTPSTTSPSTDKPSTTQPKPSTTAQSPEVKKSTTTSSVELTPVSSTVEQAKESSEETLPKTGDSETLANVMMGILAVLLAGGLLLNRRKK